MNLSSPFIFRPIATSLIAIGFALAGIIAFNFLPVAPLPQIDFPTISVQANLPGASPEVMATSVATPLERQLGHIAGITEMTSRSTLGQTRIVLQFDLSRNADSAARDVQAAINASLSQLPTNLPMHPTYRKVNPADAPIMIFALTSKQYTSDKIYEVASNILQQKLSQIDGVGQVVIGGSALPAVRIDVDPNVLASYQIDINQVQNAISKANVNQPKGQLNAATIKTSDQLFQTDDYKKLIIAYRNQNPVRVADVATVTQSVEDIRNAGFSNGQPAVLIILFKQPGANVIETVDHIRAMIPQLKAAIPAAIDMKVTLDRTQTIRSSLHEVELTLLIAMILVIFVTYLFLNNLRAMFIPGIALPLSLLGTFCVMYALGFSLNNLSLMALTISTGFVIDDAVVVLENIMRHLEMGKKPITAALIGAKEVGFTVLSMSLSLIAVFIPILFMGGVMGRLLNEFAMTLSIAILISLFISLTITPTMCAHFLKFHSAKKNTSWLLKPYEKSLNWVLHHPALMLLITLATIVLTVFLFVITPKGFFPQQDTGRIIATIQADQNISFQAMKEKLLSFVNILLQDPAIEHVGGFIGNGTNNSGSIFVTLKSADQRDATADEIINRLRGKVASIAGARLLMQAAQEVQIGGRQGNAQFQYTISSDRLSDLNNWVPRIRDQLSQLPGIADVNSDQLDHGLQIYVAINKDLASRYGISAKQIADTLYHAFGQSQISTIYTAMNQYHVVLEVAPKFWQHPETLKQIYVTSDKGESVPLSSFAQFTPSFTLLAVNHQGLAPAATLSFNLLPNVALGDAVDHVNQAIEKMHLPASLQGSFRGVAQAFQASLANQPFLIAAAIIAVYIVLGMLYESLIHPITILSTLPSAGLGALLALWITRTNLNIMALIGIILLIGIVKKNAIMMIDVALQVERKEKKSPREAIFQGALLRFRPIMMTTMAALFGALPLVIGFGLGSELRRPLGIAIIGGLCVSQLLTLYTTPVIYLSLENLIRRKK